MSRSPSPQEHRVKIESLLMQTEKENMNEVSSKNVQALKAAGQRGIQCTSKGSQGSMGSQGSHQGSQREQDEEEEDENEVEEKERESHESNSDDQGESESEKDRSEQDEHGGEHCEGESVDAAASSRRGGRHQHRRGQVRLFPRRKLGQVSQAATEKGRAPLQVGIHSIQPLFNLPQKDAAKELGISLTALKQVCRKLGVERWPYWRKKKASETGCQSSESVSQEAQCASVSAEPQGFGGRLIPPNALAVIPKPSSVLAVMGASTRSSPPARRHAKSVDPHVLGEPSSWDSTKK